jgi:hypothetical protein
MVGGGTCWKFRRKIRLADQVVKLNDPHENFSLADYVRRVDKIVNNKRSV